MLRFFRKYNKFILVIGGSLLMVVFLVPEAVNQLAGNPMKRAAASLDGAKVSVGDMALASQQAAAVSEFMAASASLPQFGGLLDRNRRDVHWLLLAREAEQAGFVGGADDGFDWLADLAQDLVLGMYASRYQQVASFFPDFHAFLAQQLLTPDGQEDVRAAERFLLDRRMRIAGTTRLSLDDFDGAMARARGIVRMIDSYHRAARFSDRASYVVSDEYLSYAVAACVLLPGDELADPADEPEGDELIEHFRRFRELHPGTGDFGIGYRLPARVKLEYIRLSRPEIEASVRVDLVDLMKHHAQNRDRFPGEFDDERTMVERELRTARVNRVMETADAAVRAEIARTLRPLSTEGGYRVLPPDWASLRPDFVAIAEAVVQVVRETEGVTIPLPAVWIKAAGWLTGSDLLELDGIGQARARIGVQELTFPQLVSGVRELAGPNELRLQVGEPYTDSPLRDAHGNRYYFTVLGAASAQAPESIDDLQDPSVVVRDWRSLRAFDGLVAQSDEIVARAAESGLEAVAEEYLPHPDGVEPGHDPASHIEQRLSVFRDGVMPAVRYDTEAFRTAVRSAAARIDPTRPIADTPMVDRVIAVPVTHVRGLVVARLDGFVPLTIERYRELGERAEQQYTLQFLQGDTFAANPYTLDSLMRRHRFVLMGDYVPGGDDGDELGTEIDAPTFENGGLLGD